MLGYASSASDTEESETDKAEAAEKYADRCESLEQPFPEPRTEGKLLAGNLLLFATHRTVLPPGLIALP